MKLSIRFHHITSQSINLFSNKIIVIFSLIVIGFLCYIPSFSGSLYWDDADFIVNNMYVKNFQLDKFFTHQAVEGSGKPSNYFRPIQFSLYALTYKLFATYPLPYHALSIIIHIIASVFVYLCMYELLFKYYPTVKRKHHIIVLSSFIIATVFLLHPVQTEAVSYVSGISDPLVALLGFFTLWLFLKTPANKLPITAIIFYIFTLLSKESGMIFGGIIFLLWILEMLHSRKSTRTFQQVIYSFSLSILPFFIISCVYLLYHTQVIQILDMTLIYGDHPYTHSVLLRLITFLSFLPEYLKVALFPATLYYDRDFSVTIPDSLWHLPSFLVIGVIVTVFISLLYATKRNMLWSLSLFFFVGFFVSFLPFSGIILINGLMYEHFLYIPIVFLSGWIITTIFLFTNKKNIQLTLTSVCIVTLVIMPLFIVRSWKRQYEWNNPIRLYVQTLEHVPNSFRVRNNLAMEYQQSGEIKKAIEEYNKVIQLSPHIPNPYHNLGNLFFEQKQYDEAEHYFYKAIEVDPSFGYSYSALLKLYAETGNQNKLEVIKQNIKEIFNNESL
jgi:hypothetical protein